MNEEPFIKQLEDIVDSYIEKPRKITPDLNTVVEDCINHFGDSTVAFLATLMALNNTFSKLLDISSEYHVEIDELLCDPVFKMVYPFLLDFSACKKFED